MEQLKNIAEILRAYLKVGLKIGGYTDKTGDPDANLQLSQRRAENTLAGIVGGGLGGQLLGLLGVATAGGSGMDIGSIISSILGGGVGGGVLMAIIGLIKNALAKK